MTETKNETADPEPADESVESEESDEDRADDHLQDIDDGCGCAEVWEALSEQREE